MTSRTSSFGTSQLELSCPRQICSAASSAYSNHHASCHTICRPEKHSRTIEALRVQRMLRVIGRSLHPSARAVRGSCSTCNTGSCRPTAIYRSHTKNSLRLQLCCRSMAHAEAPAHTNRLAQEQSPYLLQHAHNPVDWYPWSTDAFERAREENKPIFLSVGYSTCHCELSGAEPCAF